LKFKISKTQTVQKHDALVLAHLIALNMMRLRAVALAVDRL
jgi:hypothetical protein